MNGYWVEFWRSVPMIPRRVDDWTSDNGLEYVESTPSEQPPLWRDLTVASAVAILLWGAAAVVFG
jgi:hypothetical protein